MKNSMTASDMQSIVHAPASNLDSRIRRVGKVGVILSYFMLIPIPLTIIFLLAARLGCPERISANVRTIFDLGLLSLLLHGLLYACIYLLMRKIFRQCAKGIVFSVSNARATRQIGVVSCCLPILQFIDSANFMLAASMGFIQWEMFFKSLLRNLFSFHLEYVFMGLFLIVMGWIFEMAITLKEEQEGTI